MTPSFSHPLPILQALYPGSLPLTLEKPDRQPQGFAGALLSTEEAASHLSVSPETLRHLCRRNAISFVCVIPSEYRFRLEDLTEYVHSRWNKRKSVR